MSMELQPTLDRIVVKPVAAKTISEGGIHIPESAQDRPNMGEVVAVGPGRLTQDGLDSLPMGIKTGMMVLYQSYAGISIELDGEKRTILREDDVLAIVEEEK